MLFGTLLISFSSCGFDYSSSSSSLYIHIFNVDNFIKERIHISFDGELNFVNWLIGEAKHTGFLHMKALQYSCFHRGELQGSS